MALQSRVFDPSVSLGMLAVQRHLKVLLVSTVSDCDGVRTRQVRTESFKKKGKLEHEKSIIRRS